MPDHTEYVCPKCGCESWVSPDHWCEPPAEYALSKEECRMLLVGLGWAVSEGALTSLEVVDLAVKLGRDRHDWIDTYGPYGWEDQA